MDRFGIGYLVIAVVLFTLPVQTCGLLAPDELQPRQSAAQTTQETPPVAASADVVAVIQSGDSTFRVLVGEDSDGRVWSAAFDDTLEE